MTRNSQIIIAAVILAAGLTGGAAPTQTLVTPKLGGGQVTADMVHIDIYYDAEANQLNAHVDDSYGLPELRPLEPGFAFDPHAPYAVLNEKAYNSQYGWNAGGFFSIPPGAAIWIELVHSSPQLETYAGWGQAGAYTPLWGTGGSPRLWRWSGIMVHNTYAVWHPTTDRLSADYHVYFGDASTGARDAFAQLDDVYVHLEWTVVPVLRPEVFEFGAATTTVGAPLVFLNAEKYITDSAYVVNLRGANSDRVEGGFEGGIPMMAVPATAANGGPTDQHAALGSRLACQLVSLTGPRRAQLSFWETGRDEPQFSMPVGEAAGTNCFSITEGAGNPGADPFGYIAGRRFTVDQAGCYCLGFRLVDRSTNGPEGGPLHVPSELYRVYLQAGVTIAGITRQGQTITTRFGGEPGRTFHLEHSPALGPLAQWQTVAGPLPGTNRMQVLSHSAAVGAQDFYRLRTTVP